MQGQNQTVNQPALNKRCNQLIGGDANDFVKDNSYEDDDKIKHRSSAGDIKSPLMRRLQPMTMIGAKSVAGGSIRDNQAHSIDGIIPGQQITSLLLLLPPR